MSNKIQVRRGTDAERLAITPDSGEPCWTTDTKGLYIGDGSTAGGIKIFQSPTTSDYSIYVAPTGYGGTAGATGRVIKSGTTTGTTANKLVDSGGGFNTTHLNKMVKNTSDDTYAKITAIDSATVLSLSADIFTSGKNYDIADAADNLQDAWDNGVENPYYANPTIYMADGTYASDATLSGKLAGGGYNITIIAGSGTGAATYSGDLYIDQKVAIYGKDNSTHLSVSGNIYTRTTADIDWKWTNTSSSKLYINDLAINSFNTCTITIGNDPTNITNISSTITTGYTIYVATTALGGSDTANDGLEIQSGTTTGTTANKLVDSGGGFTSAVNGMTVYNTTDKTWAKISAVDSGTTLSLSADIMTSGEDYVISAAKSTIQGGIDVIPGIYNCDTIVQISNGTFSEDPQVWGKSAAGAYTITIRGTLTLQETVSSATVAAGTGATQGTVTSAGSFTGDSYSNILCYFVTDDVYRLIDSHTNDALTLVATAASSTTQNIQVYDWGTIISGSTYTEVSNAQQGITFEYISFTTSATYSLFVHAGAGVITNECEFLTRILVRSGGVLDTYRCYTAWSVGDRAVHIISAIFTVRMGKLQTATNDKYCVAAEGGSNISLLDGTIIQGTASSTAAAGVWLITGSNCNFFSSAANGYPRIQGHFVGLDVDTGGQAIYTRTSGTPHVAYASNTTDRQEDTAKSGHYSDAAG